MTVRAEPDAYNSTASRESCVTDAANACLKKVDLLGWTPPQVGQVGVHTQANALMHMLPLSVSVER